MTISMATPWHRTSFERFLYDYLPQLLAEHVPLLAYTVTSSDPYTCEIALTVAAQTGEISVVYTGLPQPDEDGIFVFKGRRLAVVPSVESEDLAREEVFCVGEQLKIHIGERLGKASADLSWDEALLKAWLPLNLWIEEFFEKAPGEDGWNTFVQPLDETNWLARRSHLRRLAIKNRQRLFPPGHFGRACPFETPEGPNIGRIVQLALGAEIRDGRLLATDERPEAALGLEAAMIPLLEHDAPERLLMGANMLRQWLIPPAPEPALVQSGHEPDAPDFWCGRDLLTAFISWDEDTYEDGIVLSESCAKRLFYDHPLEPGDKMSNRHGVKGVVSRILPDAEMPRLSDGTPVELIFNFISQHARFFFGQIREAVLSRVARAEGQPMLIPPFHAPTEQQVRARLIQAGLPEDGMERLIDGRSGQQLELSSTVGWVYWGRPTHVAREKLRVSTGNGPGQRLNEYDYYALREAGACEIIREFFNTGAFDYARENTLAERLAQGELEQAEAPSPQLRVLLQRLAAAGIKGELRAEELALRLEEPQGVALDLTVPVAHPWLANQLLTRVGVSGGSRTAYQALVEANVRLERIQSSGAPESLKQQARVQLALRVQEYCATLLPVAQFSASVQFSGRAVLAPGAQLRLDQLGIADELAWSLFAPLVARELPLEEVQARGERASRVLDEIMARSWVVIHRAPSITPQTFLAFHPVRNPDRVLRLHPLVCRLLHADFDGDQAALFLPLTAAAQREAGELLSVAGHLARTPDLLRDLLPNNEALWGLAHLSLNAEGRREFASLLGREIVPEGEPLTRSLLEEVLRPMIQRESIPEVLELLAKLTRRGFAAAGASGASLSPFVGHGFSLPSAPTGSESRAWQRYQQEVSEWLAASVDYAQPELGPQLLAVKSGAWGEIEQLAALLCTQGVASDVRGEAVPIRRGYRDGLSAEELFALAPGAREHFAQVLQEWLQISQEIRKRARPASFHVLARAMRAEQPAIVFAHAASIGESDPLSDPDSRLFAGLAEQPTFS